MGIMILLGIAWIIYVAVRGVAMFIKSRLKESHAIKDCAEPVPNESNWAVFETPTFIRRGLAFPVLTEKKKRRVRKAKTSDALACVK